MGKNKKKDPSKKFALQAAKAAKADKKAQKRLAKQGKKEQQDGEKEGDEFDKDMDDLLEAYQQQNLELSTAVISQLGEEDAGLGDSPFPLPPRGNFSWTPTPSGDLYLYGGEYFDGVENLVLDDLLVYSPPSSNSLNAKDDGSSTERMNIGHWKRIQTPQPRPPARCAHSCVYYNQALYIFGGELATAQNYHHYRDTWRLDLKSHTWTQLKTKISPPPRSGHRMIVWRHYAILFGGFFEALRQVPKWYNDVWILDLATQKWSECAYSSLVSRPPPRSAFVFGLATQGGGDVAFVSGGYSKLVNPAPGTKAEGIIYGDTWALQLRPILEGKSPTWDRISKKGEYPSARSGMSCAIWNKKMVVFGGVQDEETEHHKVTSVFYDDLFGLDLERRRWFRLGLKKAKSNGGRRRRKTDFGDEEAVIEEKVDDEGGYDSEEDFKICHDREAASDGWGLDKLRANMFAFIDGDGNIVYERIEPEEGEAINEMDDSKPSSTTLSESKEREGMKLGIESGYEADTPRFEDGTSAPKGEIDPDQVPAILEPVAKPVPSGPTLQGKILESQVLKITSNGTPQAVKRKAPLPRIKAQIVVLKNTLYLYGGILEVGDREVTLDDCWSLDLVKREAWVCLWEGSMHRQVWKGVESDDNESYISTGTGGFDSDIDEDNLDEFGDFGEDASLDDEAKAAAKAARKAAKKAAKKEQQRSIREEIQSLNEQLTIKGGDHEGNTPQVGEELADFYTRTSLYWELTATKATTNGDEELSVKELKREGFKLAEELYGDLKSTLDRLQELDETQKDKEFQKSKKASKKKEKKSKDRRK